MNSGMMPSWVGTARVAITKTSRPSRPRKRSLAKAYPASVEKDTTDSVMTEDTTRLLPRAAQKSTVLNTSAALSQKRPPGSSGGQAEAKTPESEDPMTIEYHSG